MKQNSYILGLLLCIGFALCNPFFSTAQDILDSIIPKPEPRVYSYATFVIFGDEAIEESDYFGASVYYGKALKMDSTDLAVHYKYAMSLAQYNSYRKALTSFEELIKKDVGKSHVDALFWLATMQKNEGDYENAMENFLAYSVVSEKQGGFLHEKAKHEYQSCEYAFGTIENVVDVEISDLGNEINTAGSEFGPMLANDTVLYFSSLRVEKRDKKKSIADIDNNIKIYEAKKQGENSWKTSGPLDTLVNEAGFNVANGSISPDKKRMYFSRCTEDNVCSIYVSNFKEGKWQAPSKLNNDINLHGSTATQPNIAMVHGDEVLFFVSDRKGGEGNLDIWYSVLSFGSKIKYGKTRPVEGRVNTKGDEITPYFETNTNTLYFSSNWHYGYGGFDVFKSYGSYKRFTAPENMGLPYNSSANEYYFSVNSDLTKGFFASNRAGSLALEDEICCNDLYAFKAPIQISEEDVEVLKRFLPASLYFHNDSPDPKSTNTKTDVTYMDTYNQYHELKDKYKKECGKGLSKEEAAKEKEDIEAFFREYLDKGVSDLQLFLDLLLTELQKGRKIQLTIRGYASPLAKTDYNVNLTFRRISSLINYIRSVDNGIFAPYMDINAKGRGHLSILKIPLGDYRAGEQVSSNVDDKRSSVYSKSAALERKIEITSVNLEKE